MNRINIFRNKSLKSAIVGSLLLGSFAFSHVGNASYPHSSKRVSIESLAPKLCVAVMQGNVSEVASLLLEGCKPDMPDKFGYVPLHNAFTPEIIYGLCRYRADVNQQHPTTGLTPLHLAIGGTKGLPDIKRIEALLQKGAKIDIGDEKGWTPLDFLKKLLAKPHGGEEQRVYVAILKLLCTHGYYASNYEEARELLENQTNRFPSYYSKARRDNSSDDSSSEDSEDSDSE
jgi:ankyrin repeat protein